MGAEVHGGNNLVVVVFEPGAAENREEQNQGRTKAFLACTLLCVRKPGRDAGLPPLKNFSNGKSD